MLKVLSLTKDCLEVIEGENGNQITLNLIELFETLKEFLSRKSEDKEVVDKFLIAFNFCHFNPEERRLPGEEHSQINRFN